MKCSVVIFQALLAANLLLFSPIIAAAPLLDATQANKLLAEGNSLFQQQKYDGAESIYQRLLDSGYENPVVLYNLGTAEARTGDNAAAYAHLLAARRLDPRDDSIRVNLDQVVSELYPDEKRRPAEGGWMRLVGYFKTSEWATALYIALFMAAVGFAINFAARMPVIRSIGRLSGWAALVLMLLLLPPAATSMYYGWLVRTAIVSESVEVRSGPNARFAIVETLPSATSVRVSGQPNNGFQRVRTPKGRIGYIPIQALVKV